MLCRLFALTLPCTLLLAGCSSTSNPTGPSPVPGGTTASGTATIAGSVVGAAGGSSSASDGGTTAGAVTISVVGTELRATLDALGRFNLANVPGGTHQLQVAGPAFGGVVTVNGVVAGQTIELTIKVEGAGVAVQSEERRIGPQPEPERVEFEGRLTAIRGTAPDLVLTVAGRHVHTNEDTEVYARGEQVRLEALEVGQTLHVLGIKRPDGSTVLAKKIVITDDSPDAERVEFEGKLTAIRGSAPNLVLRVAGREVHTNADTEVYARDGQVRLQDLRVGQLLHVQGVKRPDGTTILAKKIKILPNDGGGRD